MSTDNIDELDLYRALQTLKDKDGNYVLSTISFSSQYGLQRLIEFIEDRESKLKAHYARREAEIYRTIMSIASTKEKQRHIYDYCAMKLSESVTPSTNPKEEKE